MSLEGHLLELRWRLVVCLIALAAAFGLSWLFRHWLMDALKWPHVRAMASLGFETALYAKTYPEGFVAQLKACALGALVLAAPMIIYQVWAFVAPGLFPNERRKVFSLGAACAACFFGGISFGYFFFVPMAFRYLIVLSGPSVRPMLMIGSYISTFFFFIFALGLAFQTPVVIYFLLRWNVLTLEGLRRGRKGIILGAFIVGAFITPPDPMTQVIMATTLIILCDLGALLAFPNWRTLAAFMRFTGVVVLVGAALVAWFGLRPVAHVTVLEGTLQVPGRAVSAGEPAPIRRGALCRAGADCAARFTFGRKARVYLNGGASLQIIGPGAIRLRRGKALLDVSGQRGGFTVRGGPGIVVAKTARAQLEAPDPDSIVITVLEGEVQAKRAGEAQRVHAGQTLALRRGGHVVDTSGIAKEWEGILPRSRGAE